MQGEIPRCLTPILLRYGMSDGSSPCLGQLDERRPAGPSSVVLEI